MAPLSFYVEQQMQFRVAAIQDADLPEALTDARLFLEDWLNQAIGDGDFGWPEGCVMVVFFVTSSLPKAPAASRFVSNHGDSPTLALHIAIDPEVVLQASESALLALVSAAIVQRLPVKPLRKPRGLDYGRLRNAVVAAVAPYAGTAVQPFAAADGFAVR